MKRHLITLAAFGALAAHSSAILNLNLAPQTYTVSQAGGTVSILGTVSRASTDAITGATATQAFSGANALAQPVFTGAFNTFLGSSDLSFNGVVATITVPAGQAAGIYDSANATGTPGASFTLNGTDTRTTPNATISDAEFYSVEVQAVPEPSAFAALGLGGLALLRRRRKA